MGAGLPEATAAWAEPTVVNGRPSSDRRTGTVYALNAKSGWWSGSSRLKAACAAPSWSGRDRGRLASLNAYFSGSERLRVCRGCQQRHPRVGGAGRRASADSTHRFTRALIRTTCSLPTSSYESRQSATYNRCTFRGAIVALDTATGKTAWHAYVIDEQPTLMGKRPDGGEAWGPSGGAIWSAPTIDASGLMFVGTGNTYSGNESQPGGRRRRVRSKTGRALETATASRRCLGAATANPTAARSRTRLRYRRISPCWHDARTARDIIVAGQKSGIAYGLDPDTGRSSGSTGGCRRRTRRHRMGRGR